MKFIAGFSKCVKNCREILSTNIFDLELTGDGDNGFRSTTMVDCQRSDLCGAWTDLEEDEKSGVFWGYFILKNLLCYFFQF